MSTLPGPVTSTELLLTVRSAACCIGDSCAPITREPIMESGAADLSLI